MSNQVESVAEEKVAEETGSQQVEAEDVQSAAADAPQAESESTETSDPAAQTMSAAAAEDVEMANSESEAEKTAEPASNPDQDEIETEPGEPEASAESVEETASDQDEAAHSTPSSSDESNTEEVQINEDGTKRVVRMLAVDEEVTGVVKRITDFGAFIDIGVGRDGLVHISELSTRRVGKVTDVLSEGQEVTAWIKKLDRKRNRISLTLIDPDTKTIRDLEKGELVEGTVTRILPYGAFVDIGIGRDALLHVREMSEGFVAKPEDVVQVGETIEARVIDLSRRRSRVDLSLKGLRPEAEPVETVEEASGPEQAEEEFEDEFVDVEVLSPMELAFKKAMEAEGIELENKKKQGKRGRRDRNRRIQDEIIERTLNVTRDK